MEYNERTLNKAIRHLFISRRHELGLTQENLSLIANTTRQFISQVEGGKRNPSLASLSNFAKAVNMTLSELFQEVDRLCLSFESENVLGGQAADSSSTAAIQYVKNAKKRQ